MTILNGQPTLSKQKSTACKLIQDSLKFWIPSCGFRIPGTGFWIPCQRNLDYELLELNSGFQKPGFRSTSKNSSNSRIRVTLYGPGRRKRDSRARASQLAYIYFSFAVYQNGEPAHQLILVEHFGKRTFAPFCASISIIAIIILAFKLLCVIASQKKNEFIWNQIKKFMSPLPISLMHGFLGVGVD